MGKENWKRADSCGKEEIKARIEGKTEGVEKKGKTVEVKLQGRPPPLNSLLLLNPLCPDPGLKDLHDTEPPAGHPLVPFAVLIRLFQGSERVTDPLPGLLINKHDPAHCLLPIVSNYGLFTRLSPRHIRRRGRTAYLFRASRPHPPGTADSASSASRTVRSGHASPASQPVSGG